MANHHHTRHVDGYRCVLGLFAGVTLAAATLSTSCRGGSIRNFRDYRRNRPCPTCGGVTDCRQSTATGAVHCRRASRTSPPTGWRYARDDTQGFGIYFDDNAAHDLGNVTADRYRKSARLALSRAARAEGRSAREAVAAFDRPPMSDLDRITGELREPTEEECRALGAALSLPSGVFATLDTKYRPPLHGVGGNRAAFVFPERDGAGKVTGFNMRHTDGSKLTYGPRGLFIPSTLDAEAIAADPSAPVVCVEGASDTLACVAMNVLGIGRPNNSYGGELFAEWAQRIGFTNPIFVFGEWDAKIGGDWPGRDGAEKFARDVSKSLGRHVLVTYPPPECKDVREFLIRHMDELRSGSLTLRDVGELLVEHATISAYGDEVTDLAAVVPADPTGGNVIAGKLAELAAAGVTLSPGTIPPLGPTGATCDTPHGIQFKHRTQPEGAVAFFPCRRSTCGGCLPRKREHARASVQHHLREWDKPVYRSFVSPDNWPSAKRSLLARKDRPAADYFRLNVGPGPILVIATVPATASAVEMTPGDAAARISVVIGTMPFTVRKSFTASKGWALLADQDREPSRNWMRTNPVGSGLSGTARILDAHGADWNPSTQQGRFWSASWVKFSEKGVDLDRLTADLQAGELLPMVDEWGGFNKEEAQA